MPAVKSIAYWKSQAIEALSAIDSYENIKPTANNIYFQYRGTEEEATIIK